MGCRRAAIVCFPSLLCGILLASRHTPRRLETAHLEAVHQARVEFLKTRAPLLQVGVYRDFRAAWYPGVGDPERVLRAAKIEGVQVVLAPDGESRVRDGVLWMPAPRDARFEEPAGDQNVAEFARRELDDPKQGRKLAAVWNAYPQEFYAEVADAWPGFFPRWEGLHYKTAFDAYEVSLRHASTHILARDFTVDGIRASLSEDRVYKAHEWLCDPAGFSFIAMNNLGVFDIGDRVPAVGTTRFEARLPVAAKMRLILGDKVVSETTGLNATFTAEDVGDYRLEVRLAADKEDRLWIRTATLHLFRPAAEMFERPGGGPAPDVEVVRDLLYAAGKPEEADKHKLDLYLPKGRKSFPVLVFVHGGVWRTGDRSLYTALGDRFARAGIGVAIPSYRLAPANPPPAQIEDVAAAFSWVVKHIAEYKGDQARIYVGGHSAGGHLAALLALDGRYLEPYGLSAANIKGVVALSGVYDFRAAPSSARNVGGASTPPFLITYCQWDYPTLPYQAREFHASLRKAFVDSRLVYVAGENHISEIVDVWKQDDPTARAILQFVLGGA